MGFDNPNDERNGPQYHTGEACIEKGCDAPAGTAWSPHWCFQHNVARIKRINASFKRMRQISRVEAMAHHRGTEGTEKEREESDGN